MLQNKLFNISKFVSKMFHGIKFPQILDTVYQLHVPFPYREGNITEHISEGKWIKYTTQTIAELLL